MAATLHIYTKNFLLYTAQVGVSAGDITRFTSSIGGGFNVDDGEKLLMGFYCSNDSSVFNADFDRPLKQSVTSGGVTTQTGLLDSGVSIVSGGPFKNSITKWSGNVNNPFDYQTFYAFQAESSPAVAYKLGSAGGTDVWGPSSSLAARSMIVCMNTVRGTNDYKNMYALFMIDFGELITPPSAGYFYPKFSPSVLKMSLA
jgi:hypothetical protein